MSALEEKPSNSFLRAFARGIRVIRAFGPDAPEMTLSEVAARTDLTRANARRILLTLETLGYVKLDGRLFSLRPSVLEIGFAYLSSLGRLAQAQPMMDALVERMRMPCNLAMLDGADIIYVLRASTAYHPAPPIPVNVGRRFPAFATPMGRVLLGGLPEDRLDSFLRDTPFPRLTERTIVDPARLRRVIEADRQRGWSCVAAEQMAGVASIGVPVRDGAGLVVAAIGMGWRTDDVASPYSDNPVSVARMADTLLPGLLTAAGTISGLLAGVA